MSAQPMNPFWPMTLNYADEAVGEHKKRKRRDAKSANRIRVFLCASCVGFAHFVFQKSHVNAIVLSGLGIPCLRERMAMDDRASDLIYQNVDPLYYELRKDTRFGALLQRVG